MPGPLSHLTVLDLARLFPGAYCTQLLADLGAQVIKVEQPGVGDPLRRGADSSAALNRAKRSITLDLKADAGREVLRRLAATADVLLENHRPGAMASWGVGWPQLSVTSPRLVYCALTAFGQDSPYAARSGHDLTFLGHGGMLAALGGDGSTLSPPIVLAAPTAGMMAAVGILAALAERDRTGQGSFVDLAITDAVTWALGDQVPRGIAGGATWDDSAGRRPYVCADGQVLTLAAAEDRLWRAVCTVLGTPEHLDELWAAPERQGEIARHFEEVFATRPRAEWIEQLSRADAGAGLVHRPVDLPGDPHVQARSMLVAVGEHLVAANPLRITNVAGERNATPADLPTGLGSATDDVLAGLGYDPDEVAELRADGVV